MSKNLGEKFRDSKTYGLKSPNLRRPNQTLAYYRLAQFFEFDRMAIPENDLVGLNMLCDANISNRHSGTHFGKS